MVSKASFTALAHYQHLHVMNVPLVASFEEDASNGKVKSDLPDHRICRSAASHHNLAMKFQAPKLARKRRKS